METQNSSPFRFLETEVSARHFADTDFALKMGRHIQHYGADARLWDYINDHYEALENYYRHLFGVFLRKDMSDNREIYFYLDFPEDHYGRFIRDRHRELDDRVVIFGILLLNLFKERYFEDKIIKWAQLEQIIDEGEHREYWQKLLYGETKRNYTPNEKEEMRRRVERILHEFDRLGWIHFIDSENIHFEILPAIDRMAKLYAHEISNVELMSEYIHEQLVS
jgi:chromosome condensin MukBEF MukE localization factor